MATQQNIAPPIVAAVVPEEGATDGKDWRMALRGYQIAHGKLGRFEATRSPTSNVLYFAWFARSSAQANDARAGLLVSLRECVDALVAIRAPDPAALAKKIEMGMWAAGLGDPEEILESDPDPTRRLLAAIYSDAVALQKTAAKAAKGKKSRKR